MCEVIGLDRCSLAKYDESSGQFHITHRWAAQGVPLLPDLMPHEQIPWITRTIRSGNYVQFSTFADFPGRYPGHRNDARHRKSKSGTIVPLCAGGRVFGAIAFDAVLAERQWPEQVTKRLQLLSQIFANALLRKKYDEALQKAYSEIKTLKDKLQTENVYLREEIKLEHQHHDVIGQSETIRRVLRSAAQVSVTDSTVMLQGETGTGKELIARAIHEMSGRRGSLDDQGELRRFAHDSCRKRTVWTRKGCIHRSLNSGNGPFRGCQWFYSLPRRNRRTAPRASGKTPSRSSGRRI